MTKQYFLLLIILTAYQTGFANKIFVKDIQQLKFANDNAKAGDTIVMKNGNWKDAAMVITCEGTAQAPVLIMAEKDGQVKLTGNSSLQIGGKYLVIQGLNFTDGHSPLDNVIAFKVKGKL